MRRKTPPFRAEIFWAGLGISSDSLLCVSIPVVLDPDFLPTPSERQRFNVLGALHAVTHEVITTTNDTYVNSESVVTLLKKLAEKFTDWPITLVLDNARYQRNASELLSCGSRRILPI